MVGPRFLSLHFAQDLLKEVELGHLLQRYGGLYAVENWADSLSVGEQQRLGFARLLYHAPRFAIMDEATSAMDVPLEVKCMNLCHRRGIACISVGHRPTLLPFHRRVLTLAADQSYSIEKVCNQQRTLHEILHLL